MIISTSFYMLDFSAPYFIKVERASVSMFFDVISNPSIDATF